MVKDSITDKSIDNVLIKCNFGTAEKDSEIPGLYKIEVTDINKDRCFIVISKESYEPYEKRDIDIKKIDDPFEILLIPITESKPIDKVTYYEAKKYKPGAKAFVPSWVQFEKGQNAKGVMFLSNYVLLGLGITGTITSNNYYDKASTEFNQSTREKYKEKHDQWNTIGTVSFIGAGLMYIWNVVDAFTSNPSGARMSVVPITNGDNFGVGLALTF